MAGIAAFQFKPSTTLFRAPTASNPVKPFFHSFFLLRLPKKPVRGCRPPFVTKIAVVARYGGGFRPGPSSRRFQGDNRFADPDYDPALDLDRVKSPSVRLLDEQQNMIGVMSKSEAIQMADDADLVLAILSVDADPPVLRLFESADYKKHKYEQQKKKKVQQKRSAASRMDIKELKMGWQVRRVKVSARGTFSWYSCPIKQFYRKLRSSQRRRKHQSQKFQQVPN
ncbi:translation initiation factor IF3-2, chloroplastic isoform X3 [Elaeis guineensis]|uniref:Translation initiation factor IF3-4, chloroplastic isoform X2 n=1 Tax=Elaeis guineensis var. tenera TaxID=51953 RepID=A0A6I9Q856_ELAGV|nr:translation initiation factor IF3-4, chloroplastic isoform X2 [Elaeis guineensis]